MTALLLALCLIGFTFLLFVLKRKESREYPINAEAVRRFFKFPNEVSFILRKVDGFVGAHPDVEIPVNPYAFALAVRQQEAGRPGLEFGVMHPDALDTDLETQLEWFLATLLRDAMRWNGGFLWMGWKKEEFKDFIEYFARKYAPVGAENDPQGLNRFWEQNVRYYYNLFKGGEAK